ncbi:DUF2797 domain-containing protein [Proteinivorax hydrogeniformans]|uniref:DUF2797 domain-containing protein n=1 Tax=Proteinivorax hydrogeniformans TaxID=1826727 RepID=A0AAU8HRM9_9FIRM
MKGYLKGVDIISDGDQINYRLNIDEQFLMLKDKTGSKLQISFAGSKKCIYCGRDIKGKTFNNGYCFPCFRDLPQNDICMVKPEKCHHINGTCRDEEFAQSFCFQKHYIYIAYTSEIKVGITHHQNIPKRWLDQGAIKGCVIAEAKNRKEAGQVEEYLMGYFADKTNWRAMLRNNKAECLEEAILKAQDIIKDNFKDVKLRSKELSIEFPWVSPPKMKSLNLDKTSIITSKMLGAKGQYLILEDGVLNLKKYRGYLIEIN